MNAMTSMKWLIRREFWEHKGMLLWAPLLVGAVMTALIAALIIWGAGGNGMHSMYNVDGQQGNMANLTQHLSAEQRASLAAAMAHGYMAVATPLLLMLPFLVFFYALGALHDERRDRSILFWKSLPVSDALTVGSKLVVALGVTPAISLLVATLVLTLVVLLFCACMAWNGANLFDLLLSEAAFYLAPLRIAALWPVYILWALPTLGWLLMVSAWARSKVFLWAVGVPGLSLLLLGWADRIFGLGWDVAWFAQHVVARLLFGIVPGAWFAFEKIDPQMLMNLSGHGVDMETVLAQSWASLGGPSVWIGAAAGAAMIAAAIQLRRRRDDA